MSAPIDSATEALERVRGGDHVLPSDYDQNREVLLGRAALDMHKRGTMPPEIVRAQHAVQCAIDAGYFDEVNGRGWYEGVVAWFRDRVVALLGGEFGHVTCYVVSDGSTTRLVVAHVGFELTEAGAVAVERVS